MSSINDHKTKRVKFIHISNYFMINKVIIYIFHQFFRKTSQFILEYTSQNQVFDTT